VVAWFNKKKAKAMAKIEKRLKAESQARAKAEQRLKVEIETRASAERKVKAEAEKMLLTQHRRYDLLAGRVEAQAKEEIAAAKAEVKNAVERVHSYKAALAQAEEKLAKAKEQVKIEAIARAKAVQSAKAEKEARERVEARAKEATTKAEAEAEEKIRSYAVALAQAEEKLTEANEKAKAEALARVEAEEKLKAESEKRQRIEAQSKKAIAEAKAEAKEKIRSYAVALAQAEEKLTEANEKSKAEALTRAEAEEKLKAESKKRQRLETQPAETIKIFKRIRHYVFHPGAIKRKFTFLSTLAILSAIAFGVSLLNDTPMAEPGSATTQEEIPVPITLIGSDPEGEKLTYNLVTGQFHGSLSVPSPSMTYTPALNYNGPGNYVFRVNDGNSITSLDTQSSTITVSPVPPKITTLTVLDSYNQLSLCSLLTVLNIYDQKNKKTLSADGKTNIVQYSDDERCETGFGSYTSYDFSEASIPVDVAITSVIVCVEHFEEEQFAQGKLEWAVGTGWPTKPVVWAVINAPVHEGQSHEAIDAWDVTNIVDTREKINSLQLQVKNNNIANRKTFIDYTYVVVEWD
jgi:hypothetical protein